MRPRSYARKPTDAYTSSRTHTRTYIYTPMYAHVRTYTRTRRNFSDNKSALQHYQTDFHHQSDTIHFYYPITVQSISILKPHWLRHLYKLLSSVTHLLHIYHPLPPIRDHYPTIHHLSIIYHLISLHHLTHIIFHLYPMSSPTHHPINMSVCYKTLSILYIYSAHPYTTVSHLRQIACFISLSDSL